MSWLRSSKRAPAPAAAAVAPSKGRAGFADLADYSDEYDDDKGSDATKDSFKPIVYSRKELLELWHPGRAQNLPAELLGHEAARDQHDGEWTEAGHSDSRYRHRTGSSELHMSMGSGRINGGLRGRGGSGLQGGVLSGLGGSTGPKTVRIDEEGRTRTRSGDDVPPPEKWMPRKLDTSASAGAWRRSLDASVSDNGPKIAIPEESSKAVDESPAAWDDDEEEEHSPVDAYKHRLSPALSASQNRSPVMPLPIPAPTAIQPAPMANGSPSIEQTAPLRQSVSRVSALSLDDELYEDPLLNRKRDNSSTPLSRSASSRDPFGVPAASVFPPSPMSQWCYRDPSGNLQGPFSAAQMQDWHSQGFFSEDLMLNRLGEPDFIPLGVLIRIVIEPDKPFTSSVRQQAMHEMGFPPPIPPWQQHHHQMQPPRQFTTDYDPFMHRQPVSQPPPVPSPSAHFGKPLSRQVSASTDAWGAPHRQDSPQSFSTPQPEQHWQLGSASSSRQASFSNQPMHSPQYSFGSFNAPAPPRPEMHAWNAMPHSTASYDEAEPLLRQSQMGSILTPTSAVPQYSTSPLPSSTDLQALGRVESRRESLVAEKPKTSQPVEQAVTASVEAPKPTVASPKPPAPRNELDAQLDAMVIKPVEQPEEPVSPPVAAAPKGKSKRQAAKEAKEAARRAAQDATVPQPSDLPAQSQPVSAKSASKELSLEPEPDSGWNTIGPEKTVPEQPPASPTLAKKAAPAPWAAGREDSAGSSLRDIQAKEAKQSQARKAAEKQQRLAVAAAEAAQLANAAENKAALPGSSTWANGPSETPASAWTKANAAPSSGKSLKDIQEEETKRKAASQKAQQQAAGGATPVRAAYAGSVGPAQAKPAVSTPSGPWMTVGAGGKVSGPPPGVPRPAAAASQPSRPAAPLKTVSSNAVAQNKAAVNDKPPAPSADLVKWVRGALQGFSANLDEFLKLLFDFPLDPDEIFLEIISDQVYANSKTLDGKRFANEFVARRKADARGIPGGKSSMADAVKTQPVKQTNEAFKVVKGKGGKKK